jgi:hypothetical protein
VVAHTSAAAEAAPGVVADRISVAEVVRTSAAEAATSVEAEVTSAAAVIPEAATPAAAMAVAVTAAVIITKLISVLPQQKAAGFKPAAFDFPPCSSVYLNTPLPLFNSSLCDLRSTIDRNAALLSASPSRVARIAAPTLSIPSACGDTQTIAKVPGALVCTA